MGRPKRGERRIDAAIDFLADLGFHRTQIRRVINEFLSPSMYGREGWMFLEEGQYRVVLDKLLEEQAQQQQDQQQDAKAGNEALPENDMQVSLENDMQVLPEKDIQVSRENDMRVSPENHLQVSPANHMHVSGVQNEAPHNGSAFLESVIPLPPAAQAAPAEPVRPPCHGWISEESESESELEAGEVLPDIPSTNERSPSRRRGPSRWDVGPNS